MCRLSTASIGTLARTSLAAPGTRLYLFVLLNALLIVLFLHTNSCGAVFSTENDTVCRCTHLTSFAVSFNPSFAPRSPRKFPVVLVAVVVASVLVLVVVVVVVGIVLALVLTRRRHKRSLKEKEMQRAAAKREAQLESAAHAADIAVLRSEISVKSTFSHQVQFNIIIMC